MPKTAPREPAARPKGEDATRAVAATPAEEARDAEKRSAPSGRVVYMAILTEGESELERTSMALFWSGIAAGLSMGFSLFAEGILVTYLPEAPWRPLVAKFGYSFGFLVVVLGRQQLFTENTLTPILPLLQHRTWPTFFNVARLWGVVLFANLLGAVAIAFIAVDTAAFDADVRQSFVELGRAEIAHGFGTTLLRGIFAGWLLALMVWLMPFAETGRVWVIILVTYLVGIGQFSHIVAGSLAAFTYAAAEKASWWSVLGGFCVPCLMGNIIGGVTLVAALNHAQVASGSPGDAV